MTDDIKLIFYLLLPFTLIQPFCFTNINIRTLANFVNIVKIKGREFCHPELVSGSKLINKQ